MVGVEISADDAAPPRLKSAFYIGVNVLGSSRWETSDSGASLPGVLTDQLDALGVFYFWSLLDGLACLVWFTRLLNPMAHVAVARKEWWNRFAVSSYCLSHKESSG
ncbi:hypothetical protein TNCV_1082171 [Trichonephila clavipes]|nr:hypothetical protein TNCV_1082171 [Trichonephila clavipes]